MRDLREDLGKLGHQLFDGPGRALSEIAHRFDGARHSLEERVHRHGRRIATVIATLAALGASSKSEGVIMAVGGGASSAPPAPAVRSGVDQAISPITITRDAQGNVTQVSVDAERLKALGDEAGKGVQAFASQTSNLLEKELGSDGRFNFAWNDPVRGESKPGFIYKALTPFDWVAKAEKDGSVIFKTTIPEQFARQFANDPKAGLFLRASDGNDAIEGFKRALSDNAKKLGIEEGSSFDPGELQISLKVQGSSSWEGRGAESVKPDNIDPENIELGEVRAEAAHSFVKQELIAAGFDLESIARDSSGTPVDISGIEAQPNTEEWSQLITIAERLNYIKGDNSSKGDVRGVSALIDDYNAGKLSDDDAALLDSIVAAKRNVEVTITATNGFEQTERTWLPSFLLYGLPLLGLWLARRRSEDNRQDTPAPRGVAGEPHDEFIDDGVRARDEDRSPTPTPTPAPALPLTQSAADSVPPAPPAAEPSPAPNAAAAAVPAPLATAQSAPPAPLVVEPLTPEQIEREEMEETTVLNDIRPCFDFYYPILNDAYLFRDEHPTPEAMRAFLTDEILKDWQEVDFERMSLSEREARKNDPSMDYLNDSEQRRWAEVHADMLILLLDKRIEAGENGEDKWDYKPDLTALCEQMEERRILRHTPRPALQDEVSVEPATAEASAATRHAVTPSYSPSDSERSVWDRDRRDGDDLVELDSDKVAAITGAPGPTDATAAAPTQAPQGQGAALAFEYAQDVDKENPMPDYDNMSPEELLAAVKTVWQEKEDLRREISKMRADIAQIRREHEAMLAEIREARNPGASAS